MSKKHIEVRFNENYQRSLDKDKVVDYITSNTPQPDSSEIEEHDRISKLLRRRNNHEIDQSDLIAAIQSLIHEAREQERNTLSLEQIFKDVNMTNIHYQITLFGDDKEFLETPLYPISYQLTQNSAESPNSTPKEAKTVHSDYKVPPDNLTKTDDNYKVQGG